MRGFINCSLAVAITSQRIQALDWRRPETFSLTNYIVFEADTRACWIYNRLFLSRDNETLVRAPTIYVRPTVECASCAWSPVCTTARSNLSSVNLLSWDNITFVDRRARFYMQKAWKRPYLPVQIIVRFCRPWRLWLLRWLTLKALTTFADMSLR